MRTVELFGLPGAGKTTLARQAVELLALRGPAAIEGYTPSKDLGASVAEVVRSSPRFTVPPLVRSVSRYPQLLLPDNGCLREVAVQAARQHALLRMTSAEIVVFQEGWAQALWRATFTLPRLRVNRAVRIVRPPAPIVVIDVSPETAWARTRGKPDAGPLGHELQFTDLDGEAWARTIQSFEAIRALLPSPAVIGNDGEDPGPALNKLVTLFAKWQ